MCSKAQRSARRQTTRQRARPWQPPAQAGAPHSAPRCSRALPVWRARPPMPVRRASLVLQLHRIPLQQATMPTRVLAAQKCLHGVDSLAAARCAAHRRALQLPALLGQMCPCQQCCPQWQRSKMRATPSALAHPQGHRRISTQPSPAHRMGSQLPWTTFQSWTQMGARRCPLTQELGTPTRSQAACHLRMTPLRCPVIHLPAQHRQDQMLLGPRQAVLQLMCAQAGQARQHRWRQRLAMAVTATTLALS